ncbi:SDR family oxidoreductase [Cryomorphaceae bacterium]|nr:SDR family oxidoreductase [Cryomorphaceae bacterium]
MEINFKGKRALITGGSRGIGFEIVKCLSENGAEVVFTGTKEESCQSALRELERNGNSENIEAVAVDYLDKDNFDSFLAHDEMQKGFDIVVNNAGTNIIKPFETFEEVDYDKLMDLNFRAPWSITQAVVRGMRQKNYGRIVNISSIWGVISKPHRALYTSSKHAILGFTKTLAVEFGKHNVLTNAVSPGFTLTELTKNSLSTSEMVELGKKVPVNRMAEPIEMARTVAFLASDLNTYINGQNIVVDGGFTIV